MKYTICIVDQDTAYLEKLTHFWAQHSEENMSICTCKDRETFLQKATEMTFDAVFASEEAGILPQDMKQGSELAYLVMQNQDVKQNRIAKYQKPENIYQAILAVCVAKEEKEKAAKNRLKLKETLVAGEKVMAYELPEAAQLDSIAVGMLINNEIKGLAGVTKPQDRILYYHVANKMTLNEFAAQVSDKKKVLIFMRNLLDTMIAMDEYLLDMDKLILCPEQVYVDNDTLEPALLYNPTVCTEEEKKNVLALFEELCEKVVASDTKQSDMVQPLKKPEIKLSEKQEVEVKEESKPETKEPVKPVIQWSKIGTQSAAQPNPVITETPVSEKTSISTPVIETPVIERPVTERPTMEKQQQIPFEIPEEELEIQEYPKEKKGFAALFGKKEKKQKYVQPVQQPRATYTMGDRQNVNMGETEVFQQLQDAAENSARKKEEGFAETVVLGQEEKIPYLIRKSTNEKILINRDIFKLGKEPSYVDYCITNNPAVSRSHADIVKQNGMFYIIDNNSSNHTYVNGVQIPNKQYVRLEEGSLLVLANESFEFRY